MSVGEREREYRAEGKTEKQRKFPPNPRLKKLTENLVNREIQKYNKDKQKNSQTDTQKETNRQTDNQRSKKE